jgi:glycosyltransferase involved in cell wall biosynthesis
LDILFVHPNFPGQFKLLASALCGNEGHQVFSLRDASWKDEVDLPKLTQWAYECPENNSSDIHPYLLGADAAVRRAQAVAKFLQLKIQEGFDPDVIYVHPGWGDGLYLKDLFPFAKIIAIMEYYYQPRGADVGFDKEFPMSFDDIFRVRTMNIVQQMSLESADIHLCASEWQKSRYPKAYQNSIQVLHEGIDSQLIKPNESAMVTLPEIEIDLGESRWTSAAITLSKSDEVVTYVSRSLEPYRGFHTFARSLPEILSNRPNCHVLVLGKLTPTYGPSPKTNSSWRNLYLEEIQHELTPEMISRIHFLGTVAYEQYLQVLQISSAHIYLTYPFVLSWSLLESMSCGAVVIASQTAPVEEVIQNNVEGLLVKFDDAQQVAEKVIDVLSSPGKYEHLRLNARQKIQKDYDFQTTVLPQHLNILDRCSSDHFDLSEFINETASI